jgi:hypothetical protein
VGSRPAQRTPRAMLRCPACRSRLIARLRKVAITWAVPGADLAGALAEGHIPHPVRPVLDLPLAADQYC